MKPGWTVAVLTALVMTMAVPARAATLQITIENLVFLPPDATAKVGDTIEWINKDVFAHTATSREGGFDITLPPKKTVSQTLTKAGLFDYYCRFHPNMKARLKIDP